VTFLAYALDMGTFLLLSHILGGQYIFANICSKLISAVFGYFLHRHFTFRSTEATGSKQAIGYFSLVAVNIPINTGLFSVLLTLVAPSALAKFIADVACLLMNYWISKVAIFKKGSSVL
jgi:putative flippase GtrA